MKLRNYIILLVVMISVGSEMNGQGTYGNLKLGAMYYQGDLSPLRNKYSSSQACLGVGAGIQYYMTDYFSAYSEILIGSIIGDDMYSSDPGRVRRNLSFKSPIRELGFGVKYSFNHFVPYFRRIGLNIELVFGGNYFYFNPKAKYKDQWVELQPLGTEGQGWAEGQEPKYSLYELGVSRGFSIKFRLNDYMDIGVEIIQRKTYTDYLDDVSTFYINYDEQVENSTELAAQLGNRTGEYLGTEPVSVATKSARGNSDKNDAYLYSAITFNYKLFE